MSSSLQSIPTILVSSATPYQWSGKRTADRRKWALLWNKLAQFRLSLQRQLMTSTTTLWIISYEGPFIPWTTFTHNFSGRSWLTPRQACAVESAARYSGKKEKEKGWPLKLSQFFLRDTVFLNLGYHVNVIFLSQTLDLNENSTCYLHQFVKNIDFHSLDIKEMFENTPMNKVNYAKMLKFDHVVHGF